MTNCPGFVTCPTADHFPLPYNGSYPKTYPHESHKFPGDFVWGVGTASYQIEGAYRQGGRGASIWDTFTGANTVGMNGTVCHKAPCPVNSLMSQPGSTGNIANDHYHKWRQDVAMMKDIGLKSYRFSVAWPRIFPTGRFEDGPNQWGVKFYHQLIDALLDAGIEPMVTMYHWDLPQGLLDAAPNGKPPQPICNSSFMQGWFDCTLEQEESTGKWTKIVPSGLESHTAQQFVKYGSFLLAEYGSKVKSWITFNEAWSFTFQGAGGGPHAPSVQPYMDRDVWPYVAGHNVIMAHALTVEAFRELQRNGTLSNEHQIGITNNQDWREPRTSSPQDIAAAESMVQGMLGWFADPIYGVDGKHDYPPTMRRKLSYLPKITPQERTKLEANVPDFFGLNHYGTAFVEWDDQHNMARTSEDGLVQGQSSWLYSAAWGFRKLLNWVTRRYGKDRPIICTEAGWSTGAENAQEAKFDSQRVMYYHDYLSEAWAAIRNDGVPLKGFYAWSLMDNFEWSRGFVERFGLSFADYRFGSGSDPNAPNASTPVYDADTGQLREWPCGRRCSEAEQPNPQWAYEQTRHAKNSMLWMQWLWETNTLPDPAQFIASTLGGDVCYGVGPYTRKEDGRKSECGFSYLVPGPAPVVPDPEYDLATARAELRDRGLSAVGTLEELVMRLLVAYREEVRALRREAAERGVLPELANGAAAFGGWTPAGPHEDSSDVKSRSAGRLSKEREAKPPVLAPFGGFDSRR